MGLSVAARLFGAAFYVCCLSCGNVPLHRGEIYPSKDIPADGRFNAVADQSLKLQMKLINVCTESLRTRGESDIWAA